MRRERQESRPNYREKIEKLGLSFHTVDELPYWNETAAYQFERNEIETLEAATNTLHELCLAAVEKVIENQDFGRLGIPRQAWPVITKAWNDDPPAIYGRFDLVFDGDSPPKLLEFNADTPTSLLEAAVIQWYWLQETYPERDQFNSIWEGLVLKWRTLKEEGFMPSNLVHFACVDFPEDLMTTAVLMDTAHEAGLEVQLNWMQEVGWNEDTKIFVDPGQRAIETLFKLYPWEVMISEEFGPFALQTYSKMNWIEPIWKLVMANKGILAILWEMFPDHPNLLPTFLDGPRSLESYVRKPFFGREGANVSLHGTNQDTAIGGEYEAGPYAYQAYCPLPNFEGNHAIIGSWVIDSEARGIGIRESDGPITQNLARFVPHYF